MSISQHDFDVSNFFPFKSCIPETLFSGGMDTICPLIPENVIVRVASGKDAEKGPYIHQRMIFKAILSGKVNTLAEGLSIPLSTGDAMLFFPFQFHSSQELSREEAHTFIAVSFTVKNNDWHPLLPLKNKLLKLTHSDWEDLLVLASVFWNRGKQTPSEAILKLSGILLRHLEDSKISLPIPREAVHNGIFTKICDSIRENFDKPISLKSIAAEFCLSPESIRKMFHHYYGNITPAQLICRLRIQNAIELLECTDEPISVISEKCGFSDPYVFSKKFKRLTGMSPRQHRENRKRDLNSRKR